MAMDGDVMAAAVVAAVGTLSETDKRNQTKVMEKMCGAIVAHIQANADVAAVGLGNCAGTHIHAAGATEVTVTKNGPGAVT